jgi:hypothetical protein
MSSCTGCAAAYLLEYQATRSILVFWIVLDDFSYTDSLPYFMNADSAQDGLIGSVF